MTIQPLEGLAIVRRELAAAAESKEANSWIQLWHKIQDMHASPPIWQEFFESAQSSGAVEQLLPFFDKVLRDDALKPIAFPFFVDGLIGKMRELLREGRDSEAYRLLAQAIDRLADDAAFLNCVPRVISRSPHVEIALEALRRALKVSSDAPNLEAAVRIFLEAGRGQEAEALFASLPPKFATTFEGSLLAAEVAAATDHFEVVVAAIDCALALAQPEQVIVHDLVRLRESMTFRHDLYLAQSEGGDRELGRLGRQLLNGNFPEPLWYNWLKAIPQTEVGPDIYEVLEGALDRATIKEAILPVFMETLTERARAFVRTEKLAEAYTLLARGIDKAPDSTSLLVLARRLITPSKEAAIVLAAMKRAVALHPTAGNREALIRALVEADRGTDAAVEMAQLPSSFLQTVPGKLLAADVSASVGDFEAAASELDRAIAATDLRNEEVERRYIELAFRRDISRAKVTRDPVLWSSLRERLSREELPPKLRDVYISAALEAGRHGDADACAIDFLKKDPTDFSIGRPYVLRLVQAMCHDEIDAICRAALEKDPYSERWALLWAGQLSNNFRFDEAIRVCRKVLNQGVESSSLYLELAIDLMQNSEPVPALKTVDTAIEKYGLLPELCDLKAHIFSSLGRREDMCRAISECRRLTKELPIDSERARSRVDRIVTRLDWLQIQIETGDIIARVPLARPVRGVVAVVSQRSPRVMVWAGLIACELRRRGYEVIFPDAPAMSSAPPPDADIAALDGIIDPYGRRFLDEREDRAPNPAWHSDPLRKAFERDGYDIYQPIIERIGTAQRRYRTLENSLGNSIRHDAVLRADVAIEYCDRLKTLAQKRGFNVLILSASTHYVPGSIFKQFCSRSFDSIGAAYIEVTFGYEYYKSNRTDEFFTSIALANLTRHPEQRDSIHTTAEAFEGWMSGQSVSETDVAAVDSLLTLDRSRIVKSPDAQMVQNCIHEHKVKGGSVVCLLGKITYDIGVEKEGGPAHQDMVDWLNHTIDSIRGRDDILLLIKPHPYEIYPEIADPMEMFSDLIDVEIPPNCILLEHRWFNLSELVPALDLVCLWHGNSTLELLAQGVPVTVASAIGARDHPIEVIVPKDREGHRDILLSSATFKVSEETRRRARMLIRYMISDEVIIPYPYAEVYGLRGEKGRHCRWVMSEVERWFREGDDHIARAADICEFGKAKYRRNLIERLCDKLKYCRRIAVSYCKTA